MLEAGRRFDGVVDPWHRVYGNPGLPTRRCRRAPPARCTAERPTGSAGDRGGPAVHGAGVRRLAGRDVTRHARNPTPARGRGDCG
ncbi:hypothetical protein ABZ807_15860 [Micromonospora sp. NPDC047548]|uniref:hypothetical protein n=1 Tax=Micromonospora sp. NPDC047548 TaxID=3155624 RepID=UPI0033FE6832